MWDKAKMDAWLCGKNIWLRGTSWQTGVVGKNISLGWGEIEVRLWPKSRCRWDSRQLSSAICCCNTFFFMKKKIHPKTQWFKTLTKYWSHSSVGQLVVLWSWPGSVFLSPACLRSMGSWCVGWGLTGQKRPQRKWLLCASQPLILSQASWLALVMMRVLREHGSNRRPGLRTQNYTWPSQHLLLEGGRWHFLVLLRLAQSR